MQWPDFRILLRPGWTLVQGPLGCTFRLAGNDPHRSSRDRRSWNCFRFYILDWHDHSRDSCEASRIDHAPKDQLNLFHPRVQRNAFHPRDVRYGANSATTSCCVTRCVCFFRRTKGRHRSDSIATRWRTTGGDAPMVYHGHGVAKSRRHSRKTCSNAPVKAAVRFSKQMRHAPRSSVQSRIPGAVRTN